METEFSEKQKYIQAKKRVEKIKGLYRHFAVYIIVNPFLVFINLRFSPGFQWFWFPMFGWGVGLIFHFLEVNNYNIFFGKNWEDKKIKEMMNEDKKYQ
jgi:hypothetical protein